MDVVQGIQQGTIHAGLAAGLATVGLLLLLLRVKSIRQTTVVHAWMWTIICLVTVASVEVYVGLTNLPRSSASMQALRFIASVSTFCPAMALLGAKRPQDQVWQFAVFSLWGVLSLPALQVIILGQTEFYVSGIQSWFMVILLVVGTVNSLPTRYGLAAMLMLLSQWGLLGKYLPLWYAPSETGIRLASLVGAVLAIGFVVIRLPRRSSPANGLNRVWIDFRDTFGVLWAMRIADRVNATALDSGWKVVLSWNGFHFGESKAGDKVSEPYLDSQEAVAVGKVFRALLRRFVSRQWILERLPRGTQEMEEASGCVGSET